ncbi:thialysine N-epsilon-acetyltransferase-like [Mytilus californianus]|uniref:thialysine N-epsilon-acetyltransferase-like n=1 Tax=Mytilus californianus TaxID=6549 RepID=UPI0022478F99|nr:thialysine N-epsilon-acetyltransferase-like [Mytilus californianus]
MLPGDCEDILAAIKELATALKAEDQVMISEDILLSDGFGEKSLFDCFVAEYENAIVGYVLYCTMYSSWVGKKVFMEDLYVKPNHQRNGVGTRLWRTAVKEALKDGCNQMEWGAYSWNTSALEFYKRQGAINMTDTEQFHNYKLTYESMHTFANSGEKTG